MAELEETKKLPPEERLKRLKEIEKKTEEEIKKLKETEKKTEGDRKIAKDLIKQAEAEIDIEITKKRFPVPEAREIEVDRLFEKSLEGTVEEAAVKLSKEEDERKVQYTTAALRYEPSSEIYGRIKEMASAFYNAEISEDDRKEMMKELGSIVTATIKKMDDIRSGSYLASKDASEQLIASYKAAKQIMDRYRG